MALVLGLDLGTGGLRAGIYCSVSGSALAHAEADYPCSQPQYGWVEQDPEDWWQAFLRLAQELFTRNSGYRSIEAICVATTASTVVVCDAQGHSLRPAILWMDCRAGAEALATEQATHPVLAYSGNGDASEWLIPKAMWLQRHEPEIYQRAEVICEAIDFFNFKLSGRWCGSRMNATCKWNYDSIKSCFYPELYQQLGIAEILTKLPQTIIPVGGHVAQIRGELAADLGLQARPLLVQGGIDAHMAMLGAQAVAAGEMLMIGGTSVVHLVHSAHEQDFPGVWGPYPNALLEDLWLLEGGQISAGSILDWLAHTIFGLDGEQRAQLEQQAAAVVPASQGLLTLDYWQGNRTPYRDPYARGAIVGLTLRHDRVALYRSAVDAIALGALNYLQTLRAHRVPINSLVVAGGICHSPLWLQAMIDAMAIPAQVCLDDNLSTRGCAVAALYALGYADDLTAAAPLLAPELQTMQPNAEHSQRYQQLLANYQELTNKLMPISHKLARALA